MPAIQRYDGPSFRVLRKYRRSIFSEKDIDLFLHHYAGDADFARDLKEKFLEEARVEIYPHMTDHHSEWARRPVFEPLSWMAYLCRRLIQKAKKRTPIPLMGFVRARLRTNFRVRGGQSL